LVELIGLPAPVGGLVFLAGFKFCAAGFRVISVVSGCVCFSSTESLILAQDERWRRA
jgi:hypothetical protein